MTTIDTTVPSSFAQGGNVEGGRAVNAIKYSTHLKLLIFSAVFLLLTIGLSLIIIQQAQSITAVVPTNTATKLVTMTHQSSLAGLSMVFIFITMGFGLTPASVLALVYLAQRRKKDLRILFGLFILATITITSFSAGLVNYSNQINRAEASQQQTAEIWLAKNQQSLYRLNWLSDYDESVRTDKITGNSTTNYHSYDAEGNRWALTIKYSLGIVSNPIYKQYTYTLTKS
jgi:hypothetical protein